jgi:Ca2+-binding EF-hand superfamily protein
MKLAVIALALVSFAGLAAAEPGPADPYGPAPARAERRAERHQMMLQRFDVNHDGRLEPRERRIARRELRHERKLRKLIRKYDLNHDGVVDQGEMPPRMARKLRRWDTNHDGWVDGADATR